MGSGLGRSRSRRLPRSQTRLPSRWKGKVGQTGDLGECRGGTAGGAPGSDDMVGSAGCSVSGLGVGSSRQGSASASCRENGGVVTGQLRPSTSGSWSASHCLSPELKPVCFGPQKQKNPNVQLQDDWREDGARCHVPKSRSWHRHGKAVLIGDIFSVLCVFKPPGSGAAQKPHTLWISFPLGGCI